MNFFKNIDLTKLQKPSILFLVFCTCFSFWFMDLWRVWHYDENQFIYDPANYYSYLPAYFNYHGSFEFNHIGIQEFLGNRQSTRKAVENLAEFERELIRTRTGEGRERAKARGVILGRKPKLTGHQRREALARREAGERKAIHRRRRRGSPPGSTPATGHLPLAPATP